jgi:hypothetical protein
MKLFEIAVLPLALVLAAYETGNTGGVRLDNSHAKFQTNARWCGSEAVDPDRKITACTWLVNSDALSENTQSMAYANRGRAYRNKGMFERAIQDFRAAKRLESD